MRAISLKDNAEVNYADSNTLLYFTTRYGGAAPRRCCPAYKSPNAASICPDPHTPPPCACMVVLSSTSISRLRRPRSSGLITLRFSAPMPWAIAWPVALPVDADSEALPSVLTGRRCRTLGAGKLFFLSTASTVRWKRLKSASALISVLSRSMVLESSLTRNVSRV